MLLSLQLLALLEQGNDQGLILPLGPLAMTVELQDPPDLILPLVSNLVALPLNETEVD
jgi:hypothetical protein